MSRVEAWGFEGTVSPVGPRTGEETGLTRCSGRIGQRGIEAQRSTPKRFGTGRDCTLERDRDGGKEAERHAPSPAKSRRAVRAWGLAAVRSERNPALLAVGKPGDQAQDRVPALREISGVRAQIWLQAIGEVGDVGDVRHARGALP